MRGELNKKVLLLSRDPLPQSYNDFITFIKDRASHARQYTIDTTKIETELGWKVDENFDTGIVKAIECYLRKYI